MYSWNYVDISKTKWVNDYVLDKRFVLISSIGQIKFENKNPHALLVFSDYVPSESEISETIWKLTCKGMKLVLVLLNVPQQVERCWNLMSKGLSDVVIWEGVESLVKSMEGKENRWNQVATILESSVVRNNVVGESKSWRNFLSSVIEATIYSQASILITGESGTGKELVSRLIHTLDQRENKGKLVLVDCTTVVPELSGSEFFGHEKGSYTSSVGSRDGAFALADNGTLFLDEISELPFTLQGELLRVIQEKTYKRVGSNNWKSTNFRLVCATNKNLNALVSEGKFRQDLYYRISDVALQVPALREHSEDIEPLAKYFLRQFCNEQSVKPVPEFEPIVMNFITGRTYQGNIRELRQLIRRIAMCHGGGTNLTLGCIPAQDRPSTTQHNELIKVLDRWEDSIKQAIISGESLMDIKNIAAYLAIKIAIELERGDKQKAAERLHVTLRAVQQHVKKNQAIVKEARDHETAEV